MDPERKEQRLESPLGEDNALVDPWAFSLLPEKVGEESGSTSLSASLIRRRDGDDHHGSADGHKRVRESLASEPGAETDLSSGPLTIEQCGICFEEEYSFIGKSDVCNHSYCYDCIVRWSDINNSCPYCKRKINHIKKISVKTGQEVFCHRVSACHSAKRGYRRRRSPIYRSSLSSSSSSAIPFPNIPNIPYFPPHSSSSSSALNLSDILHVPMLFDLSFGELPSAQMPDAASAAQSIRAPDGSTQSEEATAHPDEFHRMLANMFAG